MNKRLRRELSLLAPTSGSGRLFAGIEAAAMKEVSLLVSLSPAPPLDLDTLVAAVAGAFRALIDAPLSCWPSSMTCAGTLSLLRSQCAAMLSAVDARTRIAALPAIDIGYDAADPVATAEMVLRGFAAIQRTVFKAPLESVADAKAKLAPLRDAVWIERLDAQIGVAGDDAERYALPWEAWSLVVGHLSQADARTFSVVCRDSYKLVSSRWHRLTIGRGALAETHPAELHALRFPRVADVCVDFSEQARASNVLHELLAACAQPPALSVRAKKRISLPKADVRAPVSALELRAVRQRGAANVFDSLLDVVDVSAVHTLRIPGAMHATALSPEFIGALRSLTTLYIDLAQSEQLLPHIMAHLPDEHTLRQVYVLDAANKLESPLPRPVLAGLLHAQQIVCRDAEDAALVVDSLAHYAQLDAADMGGVPLLCRLHYLDADGDMHPVQAQGPLHQAQLLYRQLEAGDDDGTNDVWFAEVFPSLPLRSHAAVAGGTVAPAGDAMDVWG